MNFTYSEKVRRLQRDLQVLMNEVVYPNEQRYKDELDSLHRFSKIPPVMEEMKQNAKEAGLWNLSL